MKDIFFKGDIDGRYCEIFRDTNEFGKTQNYILINIRKTKTEMDIASDYIDEKNQKSKVKTSMVYKIQNNKKYPFVKIPISMIEAEWTAFRNKKSNLIENQKDERQSSSDYAMKGQIKKFIAGGLVALLLTAGSFALANHISQVDAKNSNQETMKTEEKESKQDFGFSETELSNQNKFDLDHLSYDDLTYRTYDSSGKTKIEEADSLYISYVCYNKIMQELESYNSKVSKANQYAFDESKFSPAVFTAQQFTESSLFLKKDDINKMCKGSFQISDVAADEANEVAMKLTGKKVIETVDDLYDPVKACRACIYISIKNYQYVKTATENVNVSPEMVIDTYFWGCGNIRKWVREGTYSKQDYANRVLSYKEAFEKYLSALENNKTDGSHDEYWQSCQNELNEIYNRLRNERNQKGE